MDRSTLQFQFEDKKITTAEVMNFDDETFQRFQKAMISKRPEDIIILSILFEVLNISRKVKTLEKMIKGQNQR
jgi:hypothetical protein